MLLNLVAKAQDLIVTGKGDSLNCVITKTKSDYIHFTFKYDNEIRNTLLPVEQVRFYKKGFFEKTEVPLDQIKKIKGDYQRLRISIVGGWSYRVAKVNSTVPAAYREYVKKLKSGYHLGVDVNYFLTENLGWGLKYSRFKSENQLNNATQKLKDDITIQYIGPAICARVIPGNRSQLFADFSLGYMSYKDIAVITDPFTLKGGTVGIQCGLGADFSIDKNWSMGISFSYLVGSLNEYKYNDGRQSKTIKLDKENLEDLSRIDLSVGLKWNLGRS